MSKAPRLINFEGFEINQVLHVKLVSKRLSQQTMSDVRSTCIHVHLLCDRSWLCVKTPWPWKFFKCGLFRDKNNDLLNVLGRLLFHKLSINLRCCRTGDDSNFSLHRVQRVFIHVHLLCDRSWLCVKTPWPWKFFKCGLFRDKNNDLLNVLGRLLFHKLSINLRCCRTGDDSNFSLHRVQRVLRQ